MERETLHEWVDFSTSTSISNHTIRIEGEFATQILKVEVKIKIEIEIEVRHFHPL